MVVVDYGAKDDVLWHNDEEEIEWGGGVIEISLDRKGRSDTTLELMTMNNT